MSDKFEFSNTGLIKPRKITRSEFSYVEPTVFDLATYTMVKREDLDYLEQQLSQKDEMIQNACMVLKTLKHCDTQLGSCLCGNCTCLYDIAGQILAEIKGDGR